MKNILILLFALFAVALKADDRTVPGRTLSVTPQNALIHLPEFRKRSYKVFIQDEKGIWQPIEVMRWFLLSRNIRRYGMIGKIRNCCVIR